MQETEVQSGLDNKVTLDTEQTITGNKTFNNLIISSNGKWQNGFNWYNPDILGGTAPSNTVFYTINFRNSDDTRSGLVEHNVSSTNISTTKLVAISNVNNSTNCEMGVRVDDSNNAYTFAPTPSTSDNSTKIATTAFVKAQNYITSDDCARLKSCMVGQSGSSTTNPWYKVASVPCRSANWDPQITFLVEQTYNAHSFGILRLHLRSNGSSIWDTNACTIRWLVNSGFNTSQFVLVLPTTASSTAELWTSVPIGYTFRRFSVMSEGIRTAAYQNNWTLYNASSAGQAASITTSGTQIESS